MSEAVTATSPLHQKIEQNSGLLIIMGLVLGFGYLSLREGLGMMAYAGAFFGAFFVFISGLYRGLFKREVALYLMAGYLPFSIQIPADIMTGVNLTNFVVFLNGYLWLKSRDKTKPLISKSPLNVPIYIFFGLGLFSIFRGLGYGMGYLAESIIDFYRVYTIPFFLYFYLVNGNHEERVIKNTVRIIMMVVVLVALMAIYEYMDIDDRVGGIVNQPNHLAAFFNYYMYVLFGFFLVNKKNRWPYLIAFMICFRGVMVTFSRAGYLAFVTGMYFIICFRSRLLLVILVLATAFLAMNPAFLPEGIRYRVGQTFEKQKTQIIEPGKEFDAQSLDDSAGERLRVWEAAKSMIQEHPLFGIGYKTFEKRILHYWSGKKSYDPHNHHLLIASEMGIPALLAFYWILWRIFTSSWKLYKISPDPFFKSVSLGILAGVPSLMVSNLYGTRMSYLEVTCYFWILAGIIIRQRKIEEEKLNHA